MSEELPPLGDFATRALAAEKSRAGIDSAMEERLFARVAASVAVGAAVGGAAAASAKAAATITTKLAAIAAAAAFIAGGVTGAAVYATVTPKTPVPVPTAPSVTPSVRAPVIATVTPAESEVVPSLPASALPSVPTPAAPPKPSASAPSSDSDLAAERALVERARTAIGRGQPQDALTALDAHAARFPHGRLSEEREALAVDALARSGRLDDAKARAARFHAGYPNSVFGPVVDAAISR